MTSKLQKLARKPSADPAQEHLRQHKDEWNQATRALIAGLIALKRGLNGRGDPRAGLPPSNIKEPLPPEIVNYVNEIASRYEKVMGDAAAIVHEQEAYSQNRRKSRKNLLTQMSPANNNTGNPFEQLAVASTGTSELIAVGSNPLSRLWSKLTMWRQLTKSLRVHRLRMLDECADFTKEFRETKGYLLEQEPESIPNAIGHIAAIGERYTGVFLKSYAVLADEHLKLLEFEKLEKQKKPSEDIAIPAVEKPQVEEVKNLPKEELVKEKEVVSPAIVPSPENPKLVKYKFFAEQMHYANFVVIYLEQLDNIEKSNKKTLRNLLGGLGQRIAALYAVMIDSSSEAASYMVDAWNLDKLLDMIQQNYDILLEMCGKMLGGAGPDFKDLAKRVRVLGLKSKVSSLLESVQTQDTLNKMASNAVERWLRHNLLKISPNSQQRLLLDIVSDIDKIIDAMDVLMDALEDTQSSIQKIDALVISVTALLGKIINRMILTARVYISIAERRKDSVHYVMSMREKIRRLTVIEETLKTHLEPLQLESKTENTNQQAPKASTELLAAMDRVEEVLDRQDELGLNQK